MIKAMNSTGIGLSSPGVASGGASKGEASGDSSVQGNDGNEFEKEMSELGGSLSANPSQTSERAPMSASTVALSSASLQASQAGANPAATVTDARMATALSKDMMGAASTRSGTADVGLRSPLADQLPDTMRSAAGMNTGSAIAGLRPWSKEWVFQPGDLPEASSQEAAALEQLKGQLLAGARSNGQGKDSADAILGQLRSTGDFKPEELAALQAVLNGQGAEGMEGLESVETAGGQPRAARLISGEEYLSQLKGASPEAAGALGAAVVGPTGDPSAKGQMSGQSGQQTGQNLMRGRGAAGAAARSAASGETGVISDLKGGVGAGAPKSLRSPIPMASTQFADLMQSNPGVQGQPQSQVLNSGLRAAAGASAQLSANVVQGSMARERLATDAVIGLSSKIGQMGVSGTGGEIRMRLNPDNLGELRISVSTQGSDVGLKIQASDERAKKILEESMSSLKENLASQNLSLAKVDVSVHQVPTSTGSSDLRHDFSNQQSQAQQQYMDLNSGSQNGRSGRSYAVDSDRGAGGLTRGVGASTGLQSSRAASAKADGRVDVLV